EDLGNAIRKIRTDLGIPIKMEPMRMQRRAADASGDYWAVGTINYDAVDGKEAENGTLIYVKPGVYQDDLLPKDVFNYASSCSDFPHESTADQWFSESQFESYRMLGRHVVDHIAGSYDEKPLDPALTVSEFAARVMKRHKGAPRDEYRPVVMEQLRIRRQKGDLRDDPGSFGGDGGARGNVVRAKRP
ncbi:MAG: hypothetical protein JWO56_3511, partial [Acidobacteria bacterium]|nr:hypothetical protein [Acidobacteriota bacterium]